MLFLRWLHVVAAALLVGGSLSAGIASRVAAGSKADPRAADAVGRALWGLVNVGLALLLISGVGSIAFVGNVSAWMKQPWMHVMLTCFLAAGAIAGIGAKRARLLAAGEAEDAPKARGLLVTLATVQLLVGLVAIAAGIFRF